MSKYIEAEKAIEVCDWYEHEYSECEEYIRTIAEDIRYLPAADVAEVRHGRWEYTKELYRDPNGNHLFYGKICSECNSVSPYDSPYCMNCGANMQQGVTLVGAKMDEVERNEN